MPFTFFFLNCIDLAFKVQKQWWMKLDAVILFIITKHSQEIMIMPVSLNILDGAIKIVNCINSQPLSMTCAEMESMYQALPKNRGGCFEKNHLYD